MVMYMMAVRVEMRILREICILVPHAPTCVNTPDNSAPMHPAHTKTHQQGSVLVKNVSPVSPVMMKSC